MPDKQPSPPPAPLTDAEEATLDTVAREFPFPLALTCLRIRQSLEREPLQPVETAWRVRDAFECLLKFVAYIAAADFLPCSGPVEKADEIAKNKGVIAATLIDGSGLTVGKWDDLIHFALSVNANGRRSDRTTGNFL